MKKELEEGQIVLCKVTKIVGTIVFVDIEEYDIEGTIIFSEISPGRIRNIRDYAFPGKRIICKVLKIDSQGIRLSLRRVKQKEISEFNDYLKKEKSYQALLKTILKDKAQNIIEKIREKEESLTDLLDNAKEDPKLLEKYIPKKEAEAILKILKEKKEKETILKRKFSLSSKSSDGISVIKDIINKAKKDCNDCSISYVSAGKYLIKIKTRDLKKADSDIDRIMENLEELADKEKCSFKELK